MKEYVSIESVWAREILDSRGNPTIEVEVLTEGGYFGRASVPSGESAGAYEAVELRDGTKSRYSGKGVLHAVENVNEIIAPELEGMNVFDQVAVDKLITELDGTANKSKLGANAISSVSLAVAKAAAEAAGLSLYSYIGGFNAKTLPVPMMNVIGGGRRANNGINFKEIMIVPTGVKSFAEAIRCCSEINESLKKLLIKNDFSIYMGEEGSLIPEVKSDEEALSFLVEAIKDAGYTPGLDVHLAINAAATDMFDEGKQAGKADGYYFWKKNLWYNIESMVEYWVQLIKQYPIISIEDPMDEDDLEGWELLTAKLGKRVQLVGSDIFASDANRLSNVIDKGVANSIVIKFNQIGTLTETLDVIRTAIQHGYTTVISHRTGETEDTIIADLAVALNCGQIKTGALSRTDRVAKYNQLLRIEEELGEISVYPGEKAWYNISSDG